MATTVVGLFDNMGEAESAVRDLIVPEANVSRPSNTARDASSTMRADRSAAISAITSRIALAPMSRTATRCDACESHKLAIVAACARRSRNVRVTNG